MSRSKKSRKPGSAPTAKPKLSKQELANVEKRVRKKTGKQSGNRQQEAKPKNSNSAGQQANKDPRLGNKTPIALGKLSKKVEKQSVKAKAKEVAPLAAVRSVRPELETMSAQQELVAIEQDEMLQSILAKQDDEIALTEQEVDFFNTMMERHQELREALGLDDEEQDEDQGQVSNEEELWDKLDGHDFSDFDKD